MKTLLVLITTLMMATAFADDNFARFSIDKTVYEQLSSAQQAALVAKTQEIGRFIETKVRTKIPDFLYEKTRNLKVKILLTDKPGRDGLFIPQDSGEHTIAVQLVQLNSNGIKALIAHEIFHAIHFQINPDEAAWVREGMAQLFEFMTTGELNGMNLYAAINNPMTPLLGDYDPEETNAAQYGHDQLYFYYMYSHCGTEDFFWRLAQGDNGSGLKGSFLIDSILDKMALKPSECLNFTDSAIAFEVAKSHNQIQFTGSDDKNKYSVIAGDIAPQFMKANTTAGLKAILTAMPVLSSFRIPLRDYTNLKGDCPTCAVYFANNNFPFTVTETLPKKTLDTDVILVKLRRN